MTIRGREVEAAAIAAATPGRRRLGAGAVVARRAALVVVAALALAGCGDVGDPDLGVAPGSTSPGSVPAAPSADAASSAGPATAPFTAQLTPNRPADFTPEVLIADAGGVRTLGGRPLVEGVVANRAFDDPTGGLVAELEAGADRRIVWYPAASESGQVVAEGSDRLLDVAFIDGSVHAVVADTERVALLRLGEPAERVLFPVEADSTVVSLSAAAGLYAVVVRDAACGRLEFRRADGTPIDVGGVSAPACETPGRATFGLVAFSPDGDTVAYTQRTFRTDGVIAASELVVHDLFGVELHRSTIGGEDQAVLSLALDRDQVVLLRQAAVPELVRLRLSQPAQATVTPVEGARSASFTRVPAPER